MTNRYVYVPRLDVVGVKKVNVCFEWFSGFALSQKRKSIKSLHDNAMNFFGIEKILEVSNKSEENLGIALSAFNLSLKTKSGKTLFLESLFQGSKVFEKGGPFIDLYGKSALEAKKDERLKSSGLLIGFDFNGQKFDIKPRTLFYDWLYINLLKNDENLLKNVMDYDGFTDIEFNPKKSLNCQAYSVALAVSLMRNNLFKQALLSVESFKEVLAEEYKEQNKDFADQPSLCL